MDGATLGDASAQRKDYSCMIYLALGRAKLRTFQQFQAAGLELHLLLEKVVSHAQ